MKPFLILQVRPEDAAANDELEAFQLVGNLGDTDIRRIRLEQGNLPDINLSDYSGVIVGGGPYCVSDNEDSKPRPQRELEDWLKKVLKEVYEADFPYLGACYGLGILVQTLGGKVSKERYAETLEAAKVTLTRAALDDPLTENLSKDFLAFVGHKEACQGVPQEAVHLAQTPKCPVQMIRYKENIYATQFHPELDGPTFARRIRIYRDAGYFPPEDTETLAEAVLNEPVTEPRTLLGNFVQRYKVEI